jgi:hypothetical protein
MGTFLHLCAAILVSLGADQAKEAVPATHSWVTVRVIGLGNFNWKLNYLFSNLPRVAGGPD